jgi:AcrR family transcriptional regulator
VVNSAAEVFAERGSLATTMEDLSEATGLAAGGLYHYIHSKEQLLFEICAELLDPLLEQAHAIVSEPVSPEITLSPSTRHRPDYSQRMVGLLIDGLRNTEPAQP